MSDTLDQEKFEKLRSLLTEAYTNKEVAEYRFGALLNDLACLTNIRAVGSRNISCDSCKYSCHLRIAYHNSCIGNRKVVCDYHSPEEAK